MRAEAAVNGHQKPRQSEQMVVRNILKARLGTLLYYWNNFVSFLFPTE